MLLQEKKLCPLFKNGTTKHLDLVCLLFEVGLLCKSLVLERMAVFLTCEFPLHVPASYVNYMNISEVSTSSF